tara:strand:+ start:69 stop:1352 length:1284 start_codon:yes stop_codon:yes gene_type:complete
MRREKGTLARREQRLAYGLLLPTFLLVFSIVMLPLIANFWISVKPVTLADLRPPTLIVKEQLRGNIEQAGDSAKIQYRFRNSSIKYPLTSVEFSDNFPSGLFIKNLNPLCSVFDETQKQKTLLVCDLGKLDPKGRGKIEIEIQANSLFPNLKKVLLDSVPVAKFETYNVLTSLDFTVKNFKKVFSATEFWDVLKVSFYYTVFGTAGALLFGVFAALILQKSFPGRPIVRGLMLFPYVAPVIAVAFSWIVLLDPFSGALNALLIQMDVVSTPINFFGQRSLEIEIFGFSFSFPLALTMVILFEVWRYFPLSFLFILARMQSIPSDIYEAAEIDGATPIQQFWFLSLPFIAGILAILFLLRFIWTFNKFDDIFLLTGGNAGTRTLTVSVYEQAFAISNLGAGAAVAVVIFVLLLFFASIFIRFSPKDSG